MTSHAKPRYILFWIQRASISAGFSEASRSWSTLFTKPFVNACKKSGTLEVNWIKLKRSVVWRYPAWKGFWWNHLIFHIITQLSLYRIFIYFLLCHGSLNYCPVNIFDYWLALYHGLVSSLAVKNTQAIIDMGNKDARTVRLWKETLCNKGENEPCFGDFKLN